MNAAEVGPFLERIRDYQDSRLEVIRKHTVEKSERQVARAYCTAWDLQREVAARVREEQQLLRERRLSRVRAEIRRRRWQELEKLQRSIAGAVEQHMLERWRQPAQQWNWCRFWLDAARQRAGEAVLHIRLSDDLKMEVRRQIEAWCLENRVSVRFRNALDEPGLRVRWSDFEIDGTLAAQRPLFADAILPKLAPLMPRVELEPADSHRDGDC